MGGIISLIGGIINMIGGLISLICGINSIISGLVSLICGIISIIGKNPKRLQNGIQESQNTGTVVIYKLLYSCQGTP